MEDIILRLVERSTQELGAEFVEARFQNTRGLGISVIDGVPREVARSVNIGLGVRAFKGGAWGFSATTNVRDSLIADTVRSAVRIAKKASETAKQKFKLANLAPTTGASTVPVRVNPLDIPMSEKIELTLDLNKQATSFSPKVVNTNTFFGETKGYVFIANSSGTNVRKEIARVRAGANVYAAENGVRERGFEVVGGTGGYEVVQSESAHRLGEIAAEKAVKLLDAKAAPSGKFTVVLDPRLVGVFAHEAFGHACEADKVLSGASLVEGKIGSKVGNESVTIMDDPTISGLYGSFTYDDEGIAASSHVLIDRGVLKGYLHSIETAIRMNVEPNGSARAEDFMSTPIVRMSNTYVTAGSCEVDEVFENVKNGIYAVGSEYGYVIPASGQFVFKSEYGYIVRNGEPKELIRDVALSGLILEALNNVEVVGRDVGFEPGVCGKSGQSVPISTGGPHVRMSNVVIGGMR
ncbi:MAG: TldD/PmbA family protein [Candidatus Atabeyarchaeum deiterrae]